MFLWSPWVKPDKPSAQSSSLQGGDPSMLAQSLRWELQRRYTCSTHVMCFDCLSKQNRICLRGRWLPAIRTPRDTSKRSKDSFQNKCVCQTALTSKNHCRETSFFEDIFACPDTWHDVWTMHVYHYTHITPNWFMQIDMVQNHIFVQELQSKCLYKSF